MLVEPDTGLIHISDMLENISVYALAAFFTGSTTGFIGLITGTYVKKSSKALSYILTQEL